ncbi:hypothetical protein F383_33980 [Gossypium arboreum]|uniref:Uncharacterized protein n=1 Tax=Gossypium arboreum TaxID=29729 RepID=A0A0B0N8R9_GOSAR|nr:hypothetical protein F383_33980 [Gossypium arboreum]
MCCGLTTARNSLLFSARQSLPFQLNRAYCPSAQEELTNHSSKEGSIARSIRISQSYASHYPVVDWYL